MSKQPSPRGDQLRALREAKYERAQAAMKAEATAAKPAKKKPSGRKAG